MSTNKPNPMMYYQVHQVPIWVVIEDVKKADKVLNWFVSKEAYQQNWPAQKYLETYNSYAQKGWAHKVNAPGPRNAELLHQAFVELSKKELNPYIDTSIDHYSLVRMDRNLPDQQAFAKFYNLCLDLLPNISLSQLFMVQEICYPANAGGHKVWVTLGDFDYNTIHRLSRKIIIVGEEKDGFVPDIVVSKLGKSQKDMEEALEQKMLEVVSQTPLQKNV